MVNELTSSRHSNDKSAVDEEGVVTAEKADEERIWVQCNACEKVCLRYDVCIFYMLKSF